MSITGTESHTRLTQLIWMRSCGQWQRRPGKVQQQRAPSTKHRILPIEIHCLAIVAQHCVNIRMPCRIVVPNIVAVCNRHVPRRQFPVRPILAGMDTAYGAGACVAPIPRHEFAFTPRRPNIKWPRKSTVARHPGTHPYGGPHGRGNVT